jgi:hypothetical protein
MKMSDTVKDIVLDEEFIRKNEEKLKRQDYQYRTDEWLERNNYSRLDHTIYMVTEYPKSCLFEIDGVEKWIPRSLMIYNDNDKLFLPLWFIRKNNLNPL